MSDQLRPTIFALSSGRVPAAIAVVRISGPRAGDALTALGVKTPEPRKAGLARVRDPQSGEIIDEALALWFPAPNSETGENVAELQLHGGRAVVAATLAALGKIEGLRPAEAGEFTRRAFENGKLDLTAVEGLADLVGAETEAQRRQAFRQMKGALGRKAEQWRERLIQALALVEARIDFSDEADVPEDLVQPALEIARALAMEIGAALSDGTRGERLREGLVVAIAGPPNAGKSTLLNRIARREAAIVSPYAGTTRDVIEVHLDLDGWPATLLDTAGIRETDDPIELEGVRRARERAAAADLVLWVEEAGRPEAGGGGTSRGGLQEFGSREPGGAAAAPVCWLVRNKADLFGTELAADGPSTGPTGAISPPGAAASDARYNNESAAQASPRNEAKLLSSSLDNRSASLPPHRNEYILHDIGHAFIISSNTGYGVDGLLSALTEFAAKSLAAAESGLITRARHRSILIETHAALERALSLTGHEDLLAEELRTAAAALGRLTGRVDVEDILDVIFRDFCIGK